MSNYLIHNLTLPIDDFGTVITGIPAMGWIVSTCTYGGFGEGWDDFCQDI